MIRVAMALAVASTVVACGGGGGGSNTPAGPPAAPSGVAAAAGDGQVSVSWSAVAGASSYNVYWGTSAGVTKANGTKESAATNPFVHGGRANGATYYYAVTAVGAGGESALSSEVRARPMPAVPVAPASLSATPGDTKVTLAWPDSTGATSYNVYWADASPVSTTTATKVPGATSGSDVTGLTNNNVYYFVVTAVNMSGESGLSAEASAKASATPAPAAPTGVVATPKDGKVTVAWPAVSGATSYDLYWSTSATVSQSSFTDHIAGATNTGQDTTPLINGTTYYFVVTASNGVGQSTDSARTSATPVPPAPAKPTNVTVATPSDKTVRVSWDAVSGADSYDVYYGTTSPVTKANATKVGGVTTNTKDVIGLQDGTTYYFAVIAVNLGGESGFSTEKSAMPVPPVPDAPTISNVTPGDRQVTVAWSAVTGADTYNVYYGTVSPVTAGNATKIPVATGTSKTVTSLTNGNTYYFAVTAVNLGGESLLSAEQSAQPKPGLPGIPGSLAATPGDSQVHLTWTAVSGATSYNVYCSSATGVTTSSTLVGTPSSNAFTVDPISNLTPCYCVVTAVSLGGESAASNEANAVPVPTVYDVSGALSYSGAATSGRVYVIVMNNGYVRYGTSVPFGSTSYTIHGVAPDKGYYVVAYIDKVGKGVANLTNPFGQSTGLNNPFTISTAGRSGVNVAMTDPDLSGLLASLPPPELNGAVGGAGGAFMSWQMVDPGNFGFEEVSGYDVQWSTDSGFATGVTTKSVVADGNDFVLVGMASPGSYHWRVRSKIGSTVSAWSTAPSPVQVGPGTGGNTVSGTVTFPGAATGPLYLALGVQDGPPLYVARIASPVSPQSYSISGVANGTYQVYAILDQNNDGVIDPGDVGNARGVGQAPFVTVQSGDVVQDVVLTAPSAVAQVLTEHDSDGTNDWYALSVRITDQKKQVVAAELVSGRAVSVPMDLPRAYGDLEFWAGIGTARPSVGDPYVLKLTYADGSTDLNVVATVGAVLDAFAKNPTVNPTPSAANPTFAWGEPASPPDPYWYSLSLYDVGPGGGSWYYPQNGLIPSTTLQVPWSSGAGWSGSSLPIGGQFTSGETYRWGVSVIDVNRNAAQLWQLYTVP
jgi:fibronectin type 3 domain-containing protein